MLKKWLSGSGSWVFNGYVIFAAFGTYFCMYAFRRPFAVGTFEGEVDLLILPAMSLKIFYILSQLMGYCLSKYLGVKVVSEMTRARRAVGILGFIGIAELALFLFAITPMPYGAVWLFFNGMPLGMIWGLVFSYLEGRRSTELLGAGLSCSYIQASGTVKAVGAWVMSQGVSEYWMPVATGLLFAPGLFFFVYLMEQIPDPTKEDIALRTERKPMPAERRRLFMKTFGPGLVSLTILYFFLTAYRSFRDDFSAELFEAMGYGNEPAIFAQTELPVTLGVLLILAFLMKIRDNRMALRVMHAIMLSGTALVGLTTMMWQAGSISGATWMVCVGLGLYMAYVPYGCMLFDRLIAVVGFVGTAGFMIYVTDAIGYTGSVAINLYKNFGQPDLSYLEFFTTFSYFTSAICVVCFTYSMAYFSQKTKV